MQATTRPSVIDFHVHAFPDALAERALQALFHGLPELKAYTDATRAGLLASMDAAGIARSVVCSIATKPAQFDPILSWSGEIQSERLIVLPSVHPADPAMLEQVRHIKALGFKGIKLHPYYQEFYMDEPRMMELYEVVSDEDLLLVMHTGFDIAFPHERRADPPKILEVTQRFPQLKLVTTHLGAWDLWDEVEQFLVGQPVWMEISLALDFLSPDQARCILMNHPVEYLLFGTDSPWSDQSETLRKFQALDLPAECCEAILSANASRLLGLC